MTQPPLLLSGLLSITFRSLTWGDVLQQAVSAGLSSIEWEATFMCPPGNFALAELVRRRCTDSGLRISAYGSYYRAGSNPDEFSAVLKTAQALGTGIVRIWAGSVGSKGMPSSMRRLIADDLRQCCSMAASHGIVVATEFHGHTLTDDAAACLELLNAADVPNALTFWQPPNEMDVDPALETLHAVRAKLANVHVFHWWPTTANRLPLEQGRDRWQRYLSVVAEQCRLDRRGTLRIVGVRGPGTIPCSFNVNAKVLRQLLDSV